MPGFCQNVTIELRFFWGRCWPAKHCPVLSCSHHSVLVFCLSSGGCLTLLSDVCDRDLGWSQLVWQVWSQFGSECGSCFALVCLHVGLNFGLKFGLSWACNVDISGVDFGLNWPALV